MIYLPVACPGAGKSTLAKRMVEAGIISPFAVVSSDHYREVVSDNRQDMSATGDAFYIADWVIRKRIERGLDVYMDGTNLNKKFRDELLNRYPKEELTILVSDLPKQVVARQNRERDWPVPEEVFERFWSQAETFEPQRYVDSRNAKVLTFNQMFEQCLIEEIVNLDKVTYYGV